MTKRTRKSTASPPITSPTISKSSSIQPTRCQSKNTSRANAQIKAPRPSVSVQSPATESVVRLTIPQRYTDDDNSVVEQEEALAKVGYETEPDECFLTAPKSNDIQTQRSVVTDEEKDRFLNFVQMWTGGTLRRDNQCGMQPTHRKQSNNGKMMLPVGGHRESRWSKDDAQIWYGEYSYFGYSQGSFKPSYREQVLSS
ncbi:hypothetical protein DFQ30_007839 [Apophysomyces sp. BC1015]|nr:hypothetical protein DFQ30_007839 [Apophysomyces sp. BC1015]